MVAKAMELRHDVAEPHLDGAGDSVHVLAMMAREREGGAGQSGHTGDLFSPMADSTPSSDYSRGAFERLRNAAAAGWHTLSDLVTDHKAAAGATLAGVVLAASGCGSTSSDNNPGIQVNMPGVGGEQSHSNGAPPSPMKSGVPKLTPGEGGRQSLSPASKTNIYYGFDPIVGPGPLNRLQTMVRGEKTAAGAKVDEIAVAKMLGPNFTAADCNNKPLLITVETDSPRPGQKEDHLPSRIELLKDGPDDYCVTDYPINATPVTSSNYFVVKAPMEETANAGWDPTQPILTTLDSHTKNALKGDKIPNYGPFDQLSSH